MFTKLYYLAIVYCTVVFPFFCWTQENIPCVRKVLEYFLLVWINDFSSLSIFIFIVQNISLAVEIILLMGFQITAISQVDFSLIELNFYSFSYVHDTLWKISPVLHKFIFSEHVIFEADRAR